MYRRALKMEGFILEIYRNEHMDMKTKVNTIVTAVEEFIAELKQTAAYYSDDSLRRFRRCCYCRKISVDDHKRRNDYI